MRLFKLFAPLLTLSMSSCIGVINPLVTENNIVSKDEVVGEWVTDDYQLTVSRYIGSDLFKAMELVKGSENESLEENLKKMEPAYRKILTNTYLMRFHKNGVLHLMPLRFARINNELFAQMQPGFAIKSPNNYISDDVTQEEIDVYPNSYDSYTIAKVEFTTKGITARFINSEFIQSAIRKGTLAIKYEEDPLFEMQVITTSSQELQNFLAKYGSDSRLYSEESTIHLQRKLAY